MTEIRSYKRQDRDGVLELQERHGDFFFADPEDPLNFATVVALEDGLVVGALIGRKVAEGHLMIDKDLPALKRWRIIKELFYQGFLVSHRFGVREIVAAVPKELDRYADLLTRLPEFQEDHRRWFTVNVLAIFAPPVSSPEMWAAL